MKNTIIVLVIVIAVALLGAVGLKFWARPGRISPEKSRAMVLEAWWNYRNTPVKGIKIIEYRIADRTYRVKPDYSNYPNLPLIEDLLSSLFAQIPIDKADEFLDTVRIKHAGRTRIAGRLVERIRLSPRGYNGQSAELWIDPEKDNLLGWRKLDEKGDLVRGWHFRSIGNAPDIPADSGKRGLVEGIIENSPLFDQRELITGDELKDLAGFQHFPIPTWMPDGFHLVGGRWVRAIGPPNELEKMMPGGAVGRLRQGFGPGPGGGMGGQFQIVYSDGLNTISMSIFPNGRLGQAMLDPDRVNGILSDKAAEIRRLFRTSMVGRFYPGRLVMIFGSVDIGILNQMLDSVQFDPGDFPPPDMMPEGGPGQFPPFGPGPGNGGPPFDPPWRGGGPGGGGFGPGPGRGR